MKRLVYAPKVHAFARIDDPESPVIDISDFIVRGNVHRQTNAVSTAEIELRNPDKMFTRPGRPVFHPMDPITIYLTRIANHPIQVFTGYLDTTPYLQLFPGTVTLTASCTLKRLLHTYWDPALPYVFDGFLREYGWNLNPKTGQMFSDILYDGPTLDKNNRALNDGSFASLLFATLKHVGSWDSDSIYIEKLPDGTGGSADIVKKVTAIYNAIAKDNAAVQDNVQTLFTGLLGTGSQGGGGGPLGDPPTVKGSYNVAELVQLAEALGLRGESAATAGAIAMAESTGDPNAGPNSADCVGLWQIRASVHTTYTEAELKDPVKNGKEMVSISSNGTNWDPWTTYTGADTPGHEKTYLKFMDAARRAVSKAGSEPDTTKWSEQQDAKNPKNEKDKQSKDTSPAKGAAPNATSHAGGDKWGYPLEAKATNLGGVAAHNSRPLGNWESDNAVDLGNPPGTAWLAVEDGVISKTQGWGNSSGSGHATVYGYRLHLEGDSGNTYFYQHGASNIAAQGKQVKKGDKIGEIGDYRANGIPSHLHFAAKPPTNPETVVSQGAVTAGGADATSSPSSTSATGAGGDTNASAFAAYLNLPGVLDTAEAIGLAGQKSLLNDQPLFPFIQQLCQGSLRSFMSMPNGNFFAFFPDHFGGFSHRTPYWLIDDIEILDGGIDLTDEFLATHVYIIGDTNFDQTIDILDRLQSGGVMDMESAFKSGFIKLPDDSLTVTSGNTGGLGVEKQMTRSNVLKFLQKYGARPYKEELPMVRSPFFEAFLAYQRFMELWAQQFSTKFEFTFMPELYPGGIVGLNDHGVQCYVDEVIHSFDYENGFTTQAMLSAPAAMQGNTTPDISAGMVRAFDVAAPDATKTKTK